MCFYFFNMGYHIKCMVKSANKLQIVMTMAIYYLRFKIEARFDRDQTCQCKHFQMLVCTSYIYVARRLLERTETQPYAIHVVGQQPHTKFYQVTSRMYKMYVIERHRSSTTARQH